MSLYKTRIDLIRKGSRGLEGTLENADHHAKVMMPFILGMKDRVGNLGFAVWKQGHNVHEFVTFDGRRFTLRPFSRNGAYAGVRLSLRLSRSVEHPLVEIDSPKFIERLLRTMETLAFPLLSDGSQPVMSEAA